MKKIILILFILTTTLSAFNKKDVFSELPDTEIGERIEEGIRAVEEIKTIIGHNGNVISVTYSPDVNYIASGSIDKSIKSWETSSGNPNMS